MPLATNQQSTSRIEPAKPLASHDQPDQSRFMQSTPATGVTSRTVMMPSRHRDLEEKLHTGFTTTFF
jgi:hypothetical protein